jgi:hypothetical protein
MFGHCPTRRLDLVDHEGIDALIADRGGRVPQDHLRLHHNSANPAAQRGESFELAAFLVARGTIRELVGIEQRLVVPGQIEWSAGFSRSGKNLRFRIAGTVPGEKGDDGVSM